MVTVPDKSEAAFNAGGLPLRLPRALLWMIAFAIAEYVFSMRELAAIVPGTDLRLISIPLALLAVALMLRPAREAPAYGFIYVGVNVLGAAGAPHLAFSVARITIEMFEMMFIVWMLYRYFFHRFADPVVVGVWAIAVLAATAVSALFKVVAADLLLPNDSDYAQALGGSVGAAWRNWWLGDACTFLAIAGPIATLINLRHRLKRLLTTPGERGPFAALTVALAATALFGFLLADMPWLGFPPDVILAVRLLPVPFAMAMAAGFRANGADIAILIFTLIGAYSATSGPGQQAWQGAPVPATPRQTLILITTITCMVLAGISRQLKLALNEALEASQVKSRFIAMLNHELRTPLNAILGFSELMRMQSLRELGKAVTALDNIHASGQRLLAMVDALLSHAGGGETVFELHKEPLHLASAVDGAISDLSDEISACNCRISVDIPDSLFLDADPRALRQILHVLLRHVLRLCDRGSTIAIVAQQAGTDTILDIASSDIKTSPGDDLDKVESHLVNALVLAHGGRLTMRQQGRTGRNARLTFFATHAA